MPRKSLPRKGRPVPRRPWKRWLILLIVLGCGIAFWFLRRPSLPQAAFPRPIRSPQPAQPSPAAQPTSPTPIPATPAPTNAPPVEVTPAPRPVAKRTPPPGPSTNPAPTVPPIPIPTTEGFSEFQPRPATNLLEAQIALAQRGIGSGSLDGVAGAQTESALRAFQYQQGIEETGRRDPDTEKALLLIRPPFKRYVVSQEDLSSLRQVPDTWLGKSEVPRLGHATLVELLGERTHAHPHLLQRLNPGVRWDTIVAGTELVVPDTEYPPPRKAALIRISLAGRYLRAYDSNGNLLVHFPVSIGRVAEKRPVGALSVVVSVKDPNYTFDPAVFPESEEGKQIGHKLMIPPGPNNPVGVAWIGLNRPGYGIHGTPGPEQVGRTESHGCFRLANWNADYLRRMVGVGTPVNVER